MTPRFTFIDGDFDRPTELSEPGVLAKRYIDLCVWWWGADKQNQKETERAGRMEKQRGRAH